jgi:hypothetical protein
MVERVPVLYITGPVGVGKSSVVREAGRLLRDRWLPYAAVDTEWLGDSWPRPQDDPWNGRVLFENLRSVWDNFRRAGATRLICAGVVQNRPTLSFVEEAIPGAEVAVVRLRAPISVIEERLRVREPGAALDWYLQFARELVLSMEKAGLDDHVLDNFDVPLTETATEALRVIGWI